jgi:hypothetical protein
VVVRQVHLIAVVWTFLIGCAFLLVVGCAGVRSEAPQEKHRHTEASKEQGHSSEATASEEARCEGTRTSAPAFTTNDLPGCPKGGLLLGTDHQDLLTGKHGDDEVRGLGGFDVLEGGPGSDILYGGDGNDYLESSKGEDLLYGGDGSDELDARHGQRDKLYCGEGRDEYSADKDDYVDSSCEKKTRWGGSAGGEA